MPALKRNTASAVETDNASASVQPLADFGSNAERTDEVEKEGGVKPSWFDQVLSLAGRATENVFAEEANEEAEQSAETGANDVSEEQSEEPKGAFPTVADDATYEPSRKLGRAHAAHERRLADGIELDLGLRKDDLERFVAHYEKHRTRYEAVAQQTNVPAKLIAALHWRESTGHFGRYLHQGDPIGKPSRNVPRGILFYDWETAAVDALTNQGKTHVRDNIGMTSETTDTAAIATYAEAYNGLGYMNKGVPSPYVYAGSAEYERGKYVADGKYSKTHVDQQLGVLPMVGALGGLDVPFTEATRESEWAKVLGGQQLLRVGSRGLAVEALQEKLSAAGNETEIDGSYGPATRAMVIEWQRGEGLKPDGVIGKNSAAKLG